MSKTLFTLFCGLAFAASAGAGEPRRAGLDVVQLRVPDKLCRVTLNQQELGGELDRRIRNLVYHNYMVVDLDGKWLNHFRNRTERGGRSHVYYGIGKVFDAGSLLAAYTGDAKVAARTQYIIDELVKSRDADGYLGFWKVEPENRQDHINWILHEQEYINLAFVRNYRCTGNPESLAHAKIMADYILKTFPTPQNPRAGPWPVILPRLWLPWPIRSPRRSARRRSSIRRIPARSWARVPAPRSAAWGSSRDCRRKVQTAHQLSERQKRTDPWYLSRSAWYGAVPASVEEYPILPLAWWQPTNLPPMTFCRLPGKHDPTCDPSQKRITKKRFALLV